jgi:L-2-hydroxyglutarate oxidase LhgO
VSHLDKCHIEGKIALLIGPDAGFSTKFLKQWKRAYVLLKEGANTHFVPDHA